MQGATIAAASDLHIHRLRIFPRSIPIHGDVAMQSGIQLVYSFEV